jgi:hypothetical protein
MSLDPEREDKAVHALITGALHRFSTEVTSEEIDQFLKSECVLSPEGKAALEKLGDDPLSRVAPQKEESPVKIAGEYAAMHRELELTDMDEETTTELERKRQEILKRIREKRKRSE